MTLPPPPALIASALLIGWPLIQLGSVLCVRAARARMRALAADLRREMAGDPDSLAEIERIVADSHGNPIFVIFPLIIPPAIVAASLWELFGRDRPSRIDSPGREARRREQQADLERLSQDLHDPRKRVGSSGFAGGRWTTPDPLIPEINRDRRFGALVDVSFGIGFMRWPVSLGLAIVLSVPVLPLYLLAYGLRETADVIPRLARQFAVALRISPLAG